MDYEIISSDDHFDLQFLPPDLWASRLPARDKDRAPRVEERNSAAVWVVDDRVIAPYYGQLGARDYPLKLPNMKTALDRGGHGGSVERRPVVAALRLFDMVRDGVHASIIFGPITSIDSKDAALRTACHVAYNDWLRDFCSVAPNRLIGVRMLPPEPEGAAAELWRLANQGGTKQVNLQVGCIETPLRSQSWEPLWSALDETGIVLAFHVVLTPGMRVAAPESAALDFFMGAAGQLHQFVVPLIDLFAAGVLERHPNLRLVMAESGAGWVPWLIQDLDTRYHQLGECHDYWKAAGGFTLKMKPSEVFQRQVFLSFLNDGAALALIDFYGDSNLLWASDYPHPDSSWPNSTAAISRQMGALTPSAQRKLLYSNAAALYGIS